MKKLLSVFLVVAGCTPAEQPPYWEVLEVSGTPYERGFQQGEHFSSKIRSLYTQLLTNSLFPNLNREQPQIASVLLRYGESGYDDGAFASRLLGESATSLAEHIPPEFVEEMHGIADGAELPYEDILLLNTFVDSVLSVRTVQQFVSRAQGPQVERFTVDGGLDQDGVNNDGDDETDEADEGCIAPYAPSSHAALVGVPLRPRLVIVFSDPDGVDPTTVRVQVGEQLFHSGTSGFSAHALSETGDVLEVVITPATDLPRAAVVPVQLQAGDLAMVVDPPPEHPHFMRDEWIALATVGLNQPPWQIPNRARKDDRFPPPPIAFAVRNDATTDGSLLVAHHFALLDAGTTHKHTAVLIQHPSDGLAHVTIGYAGVIWGTSGMNEAGLVWTANVSDTLDNPLLHELERYLFAAQLNAQGIPFGIMGRELLTRRQNVGEALRYLEDTPPTLGWNMLLADRQHEMTVMEMDGNNDNDPSGGYYPYGPEGRDPWGQTLASTSPDDIRMAGHYQRNTADIDTEVLDFPIRPQRYWSGYFHRSVRAFFILGDRLAALHGRLSPETAIDILREPDLVDSRDSMNAVVFEPDRLRLRFAMGQVPATDGPFHTLDLSDDFSPRFSP